MPAEVHHLNLTAYAERTVIQAGQLLNTLKAVSADDLRKMDLCTEDNQPITAHDSLLQLAWEFQQLAESVMKARARARAKEIQEGFTA